MVILTGGKFDTRQWRRNITPIQRLPILWDFLARHGLGAQFIYTLGANYSTICCLNLALGHYHLLLWAGAARQL